jgi:hypothetical protein
MLERFTFFLAFAGYVGLTTTAVIAAHGRLPVRFWRAVTLIIVAHVTLVWMVRYDWHLSVAVRNGYVGFGLFHAALGMIVASVFTAERRARVLVHLAFAVVTLGAIGAVFRYDVVSRYRAPVIVVSITGVAGLARAYRERRHRVRAAARAIPRATGRADCSSNAEHRRAGGA